MAQKHQSSEAEQEKNEIATHRAKKPFQEPKLNFIEPRLTKHGDATKITQQGFFGTFVP